jgi:hypothetical protein
MWPLRHSTEPHLHFQLQNHTDFFRAAGLPIAFSGWRVNGGPAPRTGISSQRDAGAARAHDRSSYGQLALTIRCRGRGAVQVFALRAILKFGAVHELR